MHGAADQPRDRVSGPVPVRTVDEVREAVHARLAGAHPPPLPGSGRTAERWETLTAECARNADVGRLLEAHWDADAILAEVEGTRVAAGELWAVWAAQPPRPALRVERDADGVERLVGVKPWCSGASICTHALVTAAGDDGVRLYAVDLGADGVEPAAGGWAWPGLAASDTEQVRFRDVPARRVGDGTEYLDRPGFWHGAIGVAACWLGVVTRTVRPLADRCRRPSPSELDLAALGAVDSALAAARWSLRAAAAEVDAAPGDREASRVRARRVRAVVESSVRTVLAEVSEATGAGPLAQGHGHAQAVADAMVYVRQSHGRRDLADLGARSPLREFDARVDDTELGRGTGEGEWSAFLSGRDDPALEVPAGPVLVVAPHPDDEVVGCGGLVATLAAAGRPPHVVVVSDGAASHPDSPTIRPEEMATVRRAESEAAARVLGVDAPDFLGLPDGGLAAREDEIVERLEALASGLEAGADAPLTVVAPWLGDGHPDHDAVARACRTLAARGGRALLEYPVWLWHHRAPGDPEVPWERLRVLPLGEHALRARREAVACFRSQVAPLSDADADQPILPRHVLTRLLRDSERFFA